MGPTEPLPAGFTIAIEPGTRRLDHGRVLIGGVPLCLLRLSHTGAVIVDALVEGRPVTDGASGRLARALVERGMAHPRPPAVDLAGLTVVIPVRDRSSGLDTTLASLGRDKRIMIVVVDDGSSPAQARVTAAVTARAGARLIRRGLSGGPAAARNDGWRAARTDLVAFLDADCEPDADWLTWLTAHFADPAVAAVAPRIRSVATPATPALLAAYERIRSPLDLGPRSGTVRPRARVPFVPSAALVVRRDDLIALGGFDETLRVGEDVDLVWRLVESGRAVRYEATVEVTHPARPTWAAWLTQRIAYGSSAAELDLRHPGAVAPLTVSGWSLVAWVMAALGVPAAGAGVAAVTTAMLPAKLASLEHPWAESARLAGLGHLWAGRAIADAVRRVWWPPIVMASIGSRRCRRAALLASSLPLLLEWHSERPPVGRLWWIGLRLADDMAYGAGVWAGCWRARRFGALRPDLANWPGRRSIPAGV